MIPIFVRLVAATLPIWVRAFQEVVEVVEPIPDAEPVPGILEWTNAEASFYYSSRLLAISADVSLTLPVLNVALGTYKIQARPLLCYSVCL